MSNSKLVFLKPEQLKTHPKNMRRYYPQAQVQEMANSIRAIGGLLHPLLVVPNKATGMYYVVDGNMRLHAARYLGAECPPLESKIISANEARQLLMMSAANTVRYDPDPISEAMHYQRLRNEGMNITEISRQTGIYEARITNRLGLLELDQEIQALIVEDALSHNPRVAQALLTIPDRKARVKLAQRMAQEHASIKAIVEACQHLRAALEEKEHAHADTPMLGMAARGAGRKLPRENEHASLDQMREAAQCMCSVCEIRMAEMRSTPEPAWSFIIHAADETCQSCNLRELQKICGACPGVEMLRQLIMSIEEKNRKNHGRSRSIG